MERLSVTSCHSTSCMRMHHVKNCQKWDTGDAQPPGEAIPALLPLLPTGQFAALTLI